MSRPLLVNLQQYPQSAVLIVPVIAQSQVVKIAAIPNGTLPLPFDTNAAIEHINITRALASIIENRIRL